MTAWSERIAVPVSIEEGTALFSLACRVIEARMPLSEGYSAWGIIAEAHDMVPIQMLPDDKEVFDRYQRDNPNTKMQQKAGYAMLSPKDAQDLYQSAQSNPSFYKDMPGLPSVMRTLKGIFGFGGTVPQPPSSDMSGKSSDPLDVKQGGAKFNEPAGEVPNNTMKGELDTTPLHSRVPQQSMDPNRQRTSMTPEQQSAEPLVRDPSGAHNQFKPARSPFSSKTENWVKELGEALKRPTAWRIVR